MTVVSRHAAGTFCWPELAALDAKRALAFYVPLFGWRARVMSMDAGPYTLLDLGEQPVAALYELSGPLREAGMTTQWMPYVAVDSADEAVRRAQVAGGRVVMGPFDAHKAGRMAQVEDPQGARFCVWEAYERIGAHVLGEPGALGWTQLNTRDPERAKAFYTAALGWTCAEVPSVSGAAYTVWHRPDGPAGGMRPLPADAPADAPAHWLSYFVVEGIDARHADAIALGATSCLEPRDVAGGGRISVLQDPQGSRFGLMGAAG